MFLYAGPVGLCAEEAGVRGEQLGIYPQAFTHLALLSAEQSLTWALDRAEHARLVRRT